MTTEKNGWIEWTGGDCPVEPGTRVHYRMAYGHENTDGVQAELLRWTNTQWIGDIIAYRVVQS